MDEKERIFTELYDEYWEEIFKYSLAYTSDIDKSRDITHEAFTRLWLKWDQLYTNHPVQNKVWLMRAISNIVKENYRETQRAGPEDIAEMAGFIEGDNNIERKSEEMQYEYLLKQLKRELKPNEQEIFDMLEQGVSYTEMSEKLGIKEATIRSMISRMRSRLKDYKENLIEK